MRIQMRLSHTAFNLTTVLSKEVETIEETRTTVERMLLETMKMGWMPTSVLIDGIQKLHKLTDDSYEVEV